jgi:allophanate hydrolase
VPEQSAPVVDRLIAAGAILIGKTNLDQFATGLVGTRSPYGICRNPFDARYIAGGSSSGSAVAVAAGLVSFALGTDTAGSGRVPAGFNNIVGLKPTRGLISTRGVVPAVRSLDCVSIFALTCADALEVLQVAGAYDAEDPFSRQPQPVQEVAQLRVGVPEADQLNFFGNGETEHCYRQGLEQLQALSCLLTPINFQPFSEVARLLYDGPWVAERLAAIGDFLEQQPEAIDPVVLQIISSAKSYDAVAVYQGLYRLAALRRATEYAWEKMDILAVPTAPTHYQIAEIAADPFSLNRNLGTYTNFVNLLDLCGLSVPSGFQGNGLPTGLTLIAAAWQEPLLVQLGAHFHLQVGVTMGATGVPLPQETEFPPVASHEERVQIVVVGAHLSGQPLNYQLVEEQGILVRACHTRPVYRLYALVGTSIPKPGLIHQGR